MRRMSEAKAVLLTAEKIGTDNPWLELNWADIHEREGKFDDAAQKYIKVINSKTKNLKALGSAHDKLRRYYIYKRDLVKAEEIYKANIALEPNNAWARGNYASNLLYMVGDFDKAIEKAREALSIMEYGNAQQTLALALYGKWATMIVKNRDKVGAQPYFDEAQRIYPDLAELKQEASQYPTTQIIVDALSSVQM
jgi:tetratricopeptide (TPR) repeat protein